MENFKRKDYKADGEKSQQLGVNINEFN